MADMPKVYKCPGCGTLVEVVADGSCDLMCGDTPLEYLEPNTVDAAVEKHVPVVERTGQGIRVKVGSVAHPMLAEHWIQWIEVLADGRLCRAYLNPGDAPEAEFCLQADSVVVREYCNLHGLWEASD